MGTLKTRITVSSTDDLIGPISIGSRDTETIVRFSHVGTKEIGDDIFSESGLLINESCGARGAYLYASCPTTNENAIKIYGITQITEEFNEMTFEGIEPFATLQPGDSMLIPVSPQMQTIYALSTNGTNTLDYYIGNRAGEYGQSVLLLFDNGTWQYTVLDAELADTAPNSLPWLRDTQLNVGDWHFDEYYIIQDKGYVFRFYSDSNYYTKKLVFIDSRGQLTQIDEVQTDANNYHEYYYNRFESQLFVYYYVSDSGSVTGDKYTLVSFDGDNYNTYEFDNVVNSWEYSDENFNVEYTYSFNKGYYAASSEGAFVVYAYVGDPTNAKKFYILNNGEKYEIASTYSPDDSIYVDSIGVNRFANFFVVPFYDDNIGYYKKLQIWSNHGVKLHDIDLTAHSLGDLEYRFYGTNKIQFIFYDYDTGFDYLINYNGSTGKLIGAANGALNWKHEYNSGDRHWFAYDKWIDDSIRFGYYWNKGMYDPESMVIIYFEGYNDDDYFLNYRFEGSDFLNIVYLLDGKSPMSYSWKKPNDGTSLTVRIPYESGYSKLYPMPNRFALMYSTSTDFDNPGSMNALIFSDGIFKSETIISNTTGVYFGFNSIRFKPVGNYHMIIWYNDFIEKTYYCMLDNAGKKDILEIDGEQNYPGVWRSRYNTLVLRSWNYNYERVWYFNTKTTKFVELTSGGNTFDSKKPYYPAHKINYSSNNVGVNDGNMLIYGCPDCEANGMRLIKKGIATENVTMPYTDDSWNIYLGSNAVFYYYQDPENEYKWRINVYDLDFKLIRSVDLGTDNDYSYRVYGKRAFFYGYNSYSNTYDYFIVSLNGSKKYSNSNEAYDWYINDWSWFN